MTSWIYESPDGGRTIYRRVLGKHECRDRQIEVARDVWMSIDDLKSIGASSNKQQCLRHEYPALQQLWEEYHCMLRLIGGDK